MTGRVNLSRRQLLRLGAATTASALAGCPGDDGPDDVLVMSDTKTLSTTVGPYNAVEWHSGGTLVLESGGGLTVTSSTA